MSKSYTLKALFSRIASDLDAKRLEAKRLEAERLEAKWLEAERVVDIYHQLQRLVLIWPWEYSQPMPAVRHARMRVETLESHCQAIQEVFPFGEDLYQDDTFLALVNSVCCWPMAMMVEAKRLDLETARALLADEEQK